MKFRSEFLSAYMEYVDETESPRVFHIWSALSGIAACMGRRVYMPFSVGDIYPNMYVLLVGPPAVKKSTAINIMKRLVKDATGVRFAPDDTSGQRQGVLAAMHVDLKEENELMEALEASQAASSGVLLGEDINPLELMKSVNVDTRDKHSMYITASEFATFIGSNNSDMLNFLIKMWDGDDYAYKLKSSELTLTNPLLNLIGGTTPTSISQSIPQQAMGSGFMSRLIMVHATEKHARIPEPQLVEAIAPLLKEIYSRVFNNFSGAMEQTAGAREALNELYDSKVDISDTRFIHYIDRRHDHLKKLSMCMAASRLSNYIDTRDVEEAQKILSATELGMPDALGEYGLSPLSASKQRLVEFIVYTKEPVTQNILWGLMHREMKRTDFMSSLAELCNAGKIMQVTTSTGIAYVEKEGKKKKTDELLESLVIHTEEAAD